MAFCGKCGNELPEGTSFCPKCGQATAVEATEPASELRQTEAKPAKKGKLIPIIAAVAAVVVIVIVALVIANPFGTSKTLDASDPLPALVGDAPETDNPLSPMSSEAATPSINSVGDLIEFGEWRGQPIIWHVLAIEDGRALVVSEDVLAVRAYNEKDEDTTWEQSDVRAWLNDDFLNTAFTPAQQDAINLSHISNPDNPEYGTSGGRDTEDKVFLLSIDEVNRYFANDDARIAYITMNEEDIQYTLRSMKEYSGYDDARLASIEDELRSDYLNQRQALRWWLRSPGDFAGYAAGVDGGGYVYAGGDDVDDGGGVRPALWLNL